MKLRLAIAVVFSLLIIASASAYVDDYTSTKLLLHGNTTPSVKEDDAAFTYVHNWTGNATVNTSAGGYKFGGGAFNFTPGQTQYINMSVDANPADFNFNTMGDWTMDEWVLPAGIHPSNYQLLWSGNVSTPYPPFSLYLSTGAPTTNIPLIAWASSTGLGNDMSGAILGTVPVGQWSHIAIVKYGQKFLCYINGNLSWSYVYPYNYNSVNSTMGIGNRLVGAATPFGGQIDEFRFSRGIARYKGGNFTPMTREYNTALWSLSTPGQYAFVVPSYVSTVTGNFGAAGGAGAASLYGAVSPYYRLFGLGGKNGQWENKSSIPVTPGNTNQITVGTGGARTYNVSSLLPNTFANSGGTTSAFGLVKQGGLGGQVLETSTLPTYGGDGEYTNFITLTALAEDGNTGGYPAMGGSAGLGFCAGGGGAGITGLSPYSGYGGAGAKGLARFWIPGLFGENTPSFTYSPASGTSGLLVNFTDTSQILDPDYATYLWDFGDGSTSTQVGSVSHVYGIAGLYTVTLTIGGTTGSFTYTVPNAVTIANSQSTTYMVPHTVVINVVDYNMNPLPGVKVTAYPINFTAPPGWINTYYGVASGVSISGTTISGTSDYTGAWAAPMLGAYQYNLSFSQPGVITDQNITFFPSRDEYTFRLPRVGQTVIPTPASSYISYYLYNTSVNTTAENFTIKYKDTSGGTTIYIYNVTNTSGYYIVNGTVTVGDAAWHNITTPNVLHGAGESLTVRFAAQQNSVGYVNRSYTVTWDNLKTLGGYPEWVGDWMGIAVLVLFAGSISLVSVKYAVVIIPALAFFMTVYARWLSPVIATTTFLASVGILFTLGVLRYIRDSKGKLGRT
jgi:PKD repeat protein